MNSIGLLWILRFLTPYQFGGTVVLPCTMPIYHLLLFFKKKLLICVFPFSFSIQKIQFFNIYIYVFTKLYPLCFQRTSILIITWLNKNKFWKVSCYDNTWALVIYALKKKQRNCHRKGWWNVRHELWTSHEGHICCELGCFEFLAPLLEGHFGGWMPCSSLLYCIVFLKYIKIFFIF